RIVVILCLFPILSFAQQSPPESGPPVRVKYDQTANLPDGLAFISTLRVLSEMSAIDTDSAIDLIQRGMGFSQDDAQSFLDLVLEMSRAYSADYDRQARLLFCSKEKPRPAGNNLYPLFEALDDSELPLGNKYLALIKAELSQDKAARFQAWLNSRKSNITLVRVRHKEHYEQLGRDPDQTVYALCEHLDRTPE